MSSLKRLATMAKRAPPPSSRPRSPVTPPGAPGSRSTGWPMGRLAGFGLRRGCRRGGAGRRIEGGRRSRIGEQVAQLVALGLEIPPVIRRGRHLDRLAAGDLQAVALEPHDLARVVRE